MAETPADLADSGAEGMDAAALRDDAQWSLPARRWVVIAALGLGFVLALLDTHDHAQGAATLQWERRCLQRFSLLYAKYKPQRYWYLVRVRARLRLS